MFTKQMIYLLLVFVLFALLLFIACGEDHPQLPLPIPEEEKGTIIVQVVDTSNKPVEGATITTSPALSTPIPTENAGEYKIENVPPKTYTVHAKKDDLEGEEEVMVGAKESKIKIMIDKPKVTIIDVKVLYDDGGPVAGASIRTEPETVRAITDDKGTASLKFSITKEQIYTVFTKKDEIEKASDQISVMPGGQYKVTIEFSKLLCQITDPKPGQNVPWRYAVKGKVSKGVVELIEKLKPNLAPGERIEMGVYVWDPIDPHGPWRQYPAQVQKDGTWAQSEIDEIVGGVRRGRSYFGNEGMPKGVRFKVRAQLEKYKEDLNIPIDKTKGERIEDVFCEIEDVIRE